MDGQFHSGLRMVQATPEQQAAIEKLLGGAAGGMKTGEKIMSVFFLVGHGQKTEDGGQRSEEGQRSTFNAQRSTFNEDGPAGSEMADGRGQRAEDRGAYRFRHLGSHWEVVFAGGQRFTVPDTLGARYLDYLLHHPNQGIRAFDLELAIRADRESARSGGSRQKCLDGQAQRELERELEELRAERERAEAENPAAVQRLAEEVAAVEAALEKQGGIASDAGERARNNVRKAIGAVTQRLRRGNKYQKALAAHLGQRLKLGYEVVYSQAGGEIWE